MVMVLRSNFSQFPNNEGTHSQYCFMVFIFGSQIVLHINSPNFPVDSDFGDALEELFLLQWASFSYFFGRPLQKQRPARSKKSCSH